MPSIRPTATPTCASPQQEPAARSLSGIPADPPMRFSFAESEELQVPPAAAPHQSRTDLELVEDLLDRCWQEVGATDLNPKMTDIVRLLEFKNKLRSSAEAEKTFWALINRIRHEELTEFGLVTVNDTHPE